MSGAYDYLKFRKKLLEEAVEEKKKKSLSAQILSGDIAPVREEAKEAWKPFGDNAYGDLSETDKEFINLMSTYQDKLESGELSPVTAEDVKKANSIANNMKSWNDKRNQELYEKALEGDERTWFQKGAFEDGYQFGDVFKTAISTAQDIKENVTAGVLGLGEGIVDAGAWLVGAAGGIYSKDFRDNVQNFIAKDLYDEKAVAKVLIGEEPLFGVVGAMTGSNLFNNITVDDALGSIIDTDKNSVLGEKSEGVAQSAGAMLPAIALTAAGLPPWVATAQIGVTSFGGEVENAFNQGANYWEAGASGAITAAAEILTEKLSGAIKFGGTTLDDGLTKYLATAITNKTARSLAKFGVDVAGEGMEEVLSQMISNLGSALYKEENLYELLFSEEAVDGYIESFVGGAVLGGGSSVGKAVSGRDSTTGLTKNTQKVFDKVYNDLVAEAEKSNGKLTSSEKSKLYDLVMKGIQEGGISTDTIEEVLGGDDYKAYKDSVDKANTLEERKKTLQEQFDKLNELKVGERTGKQTDMLEDLRSQIKDLDQQIADPKTKTNIEQLKSKLQNNVFNIVKNDSLVESYNERAKRGTKYEADLTKYSEKQQEIVKKAIESGFLNNTRKTHALVDMIAKIHEDKGVDFDFVNNKKLQGSSYAVDGKIVNGYFDKKANIIGININSAKYLNAVVGHEVTHVFEGTEIYDELKSAIFEYAKSKGEYDSRRTALAELYKAEDIDSELVADLVGDYLFSDPDFVKNLSVNHRNVFQKIYDEIKYLLKVATAGSKEARQLEKVKHEFEKLYRESNIKQENTAKDSGVKHSIVALEDGKVYVDASRNIIKGETVDEMRSDITRFFSDLLGENSSLDIHTIEGDTLTITKGETADKARDNYKTVDGQRIKMTDEEFAVKMHIEAHIDEIAEVSKPNSGKDDTKNHSFAKDGFTYRRAYFKDFDGQYYEVTLSIGNNGTIATVYNVGKIKEGVPPSAKILAVVGSKPLGNTPTGKIIPQNSNLSSGSVKNSLSSDTETDNVTTLDGGSVVKHSLSTWTPDTQEKVRENLNKVGYEPDKVDKWIKDVNGIASVIAANKDRLGFEAADNQVMLKDNQDYVKTLDASTLCAKRLVYQGTFDAIQHRMPNTVLTSDDLIDLLNMMKEHGVQTPCGVCYVESRRRHLGKFAQEWLNSYNGEYKPHLDELTTSDGLEALRKSHPQAYKDFVDAMNKKGSSNPKVVQLRTEYRNEIMSLTPAQIRKIEAIGGLRVQSFSDFETPHMLDMMQAVMDMATKGLHSQAYTKVPNFAWVFGDTGIKINLSLIAEGDGFDADGNLAFSSTEGMDFDEAMRLRDAYSDNVGTIIVGANDKHILACMADDRIDFIIPFHRSGWGMKELDMMGMSTYTDYTYGQKEHDLNKPTKVVNGVQQYAGLNNLYPPDYWDYALTGKENAERYLNLCAKTGREPKFSQFLVNNGDGSYSLQPDGSTDGYWKTLIDFKMYNNEGMGVAQQKVQPNFNMDEAYRVLNEYEGGANKLPVANDIVEEFVAKYQSKDIAPVYSLSSEGEAPVRYGNMAISGNDVRLEGTVAEEFSAPVRDDVAKNATTTPTISKTEQVEDIAPIAEDFAPDDVERIASLGDADAPQETETTYYGDSEDIAPVAENIAPTEEISEAPVAEGIATTEEVSEDGTINSEGDQPIVTAKERLSQKLLNSQKELANIQNLRKQANDAYSEKINRLKLEYDAKKNKDTKVANNILQRIERLQRLQADVDAQYAKRVNDIESKITKTNADLQKDHTKADSLEREYARIDKQLEQDKIALAKEHEQNKKAMAEHLKDRNAYISNRALEMYNEIANIRKGVRASYELGYLLDLGYEWGTIKSNLLNVKRSPEKIVDRNSIEETTIRELFNEEYDGKVSDLANIDNKYQQSVERLEKRAEKAKRDAVKASQGVKRAELHQGIVNNLKAKFKGNGLDLDDVFRKAKDLSTFATVDNTPQRVMEKSLGYKEGRVLADETVNKIAQNETEGIKWLNSFTDRKSGLLAKISKQYNIKPGSKESAAAQMYAEGFYVDDDGNTIKYGDAELAKDFPNAKTQENIKGLAGDNRIRQIYDDTLKAINESRTRNAYPEIPRLDNYFLHFRAMEDTFSRLGLPFNPNDIKAKDLPTDLNGVTADLKPGQPFFASQFHRKGNRTTHDLLGGLERYLSSAKNQIYHIDDIQTLRALRNYIADTYGQANGLEGLDALTEEEAQEKIKQVYGSHLSTFAKFLNEEANILAGKTALIDRGLEGIIGRRGITFLDNVNKQVGSNMVGFNVSSSLTNILPVVQAFAKTNKHAFVKGFAQTVSNRLGSITGKGDGFAENSPVMIRRQGADRFYRTPFQKAADAGYTLMGAVDSISTEIIARAKYNELTKKGMNSEQAHMETDKWVSRLMGDRSIGQTPQLYNSKTLGLVTKFQLEVRNQLDSQFYDTIQEAKESTENIDDRLKRNAKTAAKVASTFFQLAVAQHLFGKAFEAVAGYNPAFDIIEVLIKTLGLDDEEDDEDAFLDNVEEGFLTLLEDLPYTSTFTGGRIPISSALPIEELAMGTDEYGNDKSRLETLGEIAPYYVLPGGYGQVKKTIQGLSMFDDDLPIAGSYTDSGDLRFPIDDTLGNKVQAGIFGQWANKNAQDYIENERQPLSAKHTQEFIDLEMPIQEYWEYREGLKGLNTIAEKADYINSLDLQTWQKNIMINNLTDRKEDIDMTEYDNYESFEEFDYASKNPEKHLVSKAITDDFEAYQTYTKALSDITSDKDANGKTITNSRKTKVVNYLNSLDIEYGAKLILFKSEYNADHTYNYEIIDYLNSRDDISYSEMETILKELGFTVDAKGNIYW